MISKSIAMFCAVLLWSVFAGCSDDDPMGAGSPKAPDSLTGSWQSVSIDTNDINVLDEIIVFTFEADSTLAALHFSDHVVNTGTFNWDKTGSTLILTAIEGTFLATNLVYSFNNGLLTITGQIDGTDTDIVIVFERYDPVIEALHGLWVNESNGESPYRADTFLILPDNTGTRLDIRWDAQQSGDAIIFSSMSVMIDAIYTWSADIDVIYFDTLYNDYSRYYILTDSTLVMYVFDSYHSQYHYTVYEKGDTELDWGDNGGRVYQTGTGTVTSLNLRNTDYYCIVDEIYAIWLSPAGDEGIDVSVLGNPKETSTITTRLE